MPFAFLLLFLGARPFTERLADVIAPGKDGFILTGADAGGGYLPDTSVPGVSRNEGAAVGGRAQGDHTPLCAVTFSLASEVPRAHGRGITHRLTRLWA